MQPAYSAKDHLQKASHNHLYLALHQHKQLIEKLAEAAEKIE
jgi:hypothetical protein